MAFARSRMKKSASGPEFGFSQATFEFLHDLSQNNNREWYKENEPRFRDNLLEPFVSLIDDLSISLGDLKPPLIGGPQTVFRMQKDTRFSKDKDPYKTNLSGVLTPSRTKKQDLGLLYLHLDSSGGFACCGFYNLSARDLGPKRDYMVKRADQFQHVLKEMEHNGLELNDNDKLRSMPKGYTELSDNYIAKYLKLKSIMTRIDFSPDDWINGDMHAKLQAFAVGSHPMIQFFYAAR